MDVNAVPVHLHHTILDSINEGVFTVDLNKRVLSFNAAAERILGVKRAKVLGRKCYRIFHSDLCEKDCAMDRTLSTGLPVVNAMASIVDASGKCIPVRISTALLQDSQGAVMGGVETFQDLSQVERLRKELESRYTFEDIIGRSPAMTHLFHLLPLVADSESTVLIEGATGTGKELFARTIHNLSRRNGRFVAVNCAALPETLMESELFGYKAGAFTGAKRDKPGRFVLANNGTIFLDEIGDLKPSLQVRLLRVLQERYVEPLGGLEPEKVEVRVIAATNKDLDAQVAKGAFRDDLYYRIRVVQLRLPPLSERREDIPLLVDHFRSKFNHLQGKSVSKVSNQALSRLMEHDYPGNVRELENIIEQAFVLCRDGCIDFCHLPKELRQLGPASLDEAGCRLNIKAMERNLIVQALHCHEGNRQLAAKTLGINASTLYRKMRAYHIPTPPQDGRSKP